MGRKKKTSTVGNGEVPAEPRTVRVGADTQRGRLASSIRGRKPEWLLDQWIPRATLSLVVGVPGSGKSCFAAMLTGLASHACILPGYEESVELCLIPRLEATGIDLNRVRVLDDKRYDLPNHERVLVQALIGWDADLLVLDPIDSYLPDGKNENDGKEVRTYLESLSRIATETGAAVVGIRHPGKERANVCPGSRQWRAVPRRIVQLDDDCGTPPTRIMRVYKPGLGIPPSPRRYELIPAENGVPKVRLAAQVGAAHAELAAAVDGAAARSKLMEACQLVAHLFTLNERPRVEDLVSCCRSLGIGEHARDEAKRLMGVRSRPDDAGGSWFLFRSEKEWPDWFKPAGSE